MKNNNKQERSWKRERLGTIMILKPISGLFSDL
jgi:hypothetical protein